MFDEFFDELLLKFADINTRGDFFANNIGTGVRGGNNDGITEADSAVFFVAKDAFIKDLEEGGKHCRVGFFDFVEQDDGEGMLHDGSGEAEFVGSPVLDKSLNVGGENKFVHIETDEVAFAAEIYFGNGFGKFGFADTGGA